MWEPAVSDAAATCWDAHLTNSWYRVSFKQWCSVFSDLVDVAQLHAVERCLHKINPTAEVMLSAYSQVDPSLLLATGRFSLRRAEQHPQWLVEAREKEHTPETQTRGPGN